MTPVTTSRTDEGEIRALYAQAMEGWNRGSGEAFAAPFAADGDFIAFDGMRFCSRDELTLLWLVSDRLWRWCLPTHDGPAPGGRAR